MHELDELLSPSELQPIPTPSGTGSFSLTSASPSLPVAPLVLSATAGGLHSQADVSRGLCPRVLSLNRRLALLSTFTPDCQPAGSAKTSTCAPTCSLVTSFLSSSALTLELRIISPPPLPLPHPLFPPPPFTHTYTQTHQPFFLLIPSAKKISCITQNSPH